MPFVSSHELTLTIARTHRGWFAKDRFNKEFNSFENVAGWRLRAVANKARQRKKGPLVRFGGRVYPLNEV